MLHHSFLSIWFLLSFISMLVKIKSNLSLYSLHYVEACNEFTGPFFASLHLRQHSSRNATPLTALCPIRTKNPRFEPQTYRSRDERVTARPTGFDLNFPGAVLRLVLEKKKRLTTMNRKHKNGQPDMSKITWNNRVDNKLAFRLVLLYPIPGSIPPLTSVLSNEPQTCQKSTAKVLSLLSKPLQRETTSNNCTSTTSRPSNA